VPSLAKSKTNASEQAKEAKAKVMERKKDSTYWLHLRQKKIEPNFWVSDEYIERKGLVWTRLGHLSGYTDDDGGWFFPPLFEEENVLIHTGAKWWSSFLDASEGEALDRQYIYRHEEFLCDLSGQRWANFRKNTNTFLRAHSDLQYVPMSVLGSTLDEKIETLLMAWADRKDSIYDPDILVDYVLNGNHRWILLDGDDNLIGMNVADYNWRFTNFRFCIDNGEPCAQAFLRLCFYRNAQWFKDHPPLVNDGGDLGQRGLETYKKRLNPARVATIYTNR